MSPLVPALLLMAGMAQTACQRTTEKDHPAPQETRTQPPKTGENRESEQPPAAPPREGVHEKTRIAAPSTSLPTPATTASPAKKRYIVAALGDSLTDARSGGGGYLDILRERCPKSQFLNFGKGGDMTNQMRRRFESEVIPQVAIQNINTLLVYGGVNDLYSDLTANRKNDKIEEDLTRIYQLAQGKNLRVIAVTVSPWGGFSKYWTPRRGQNTQLLNSWILGQQATGLVDTAVDSFALLSCGDPNVLCPEYETRFSDGLHLGKQGHVVLGEKLAEEAFRDCL